MCVLFVDDDLAIRELFISFATNIGIEALIASDAQEAIQTIKMHPVQLMVTDIMMPGMNGIELAKIAKDELGLGKVYALTGFTPLFKEAEFNSNFDRVFRKPCSISQIFDLIISDLGLDINTPTFADD